MLKRITLILRLVGQHKKQKVPTSVKFFLPCCCFHLVAALEAIKFCKLLFLAIKMQTWEDFVMALKKFAFINVVGFHA